jgi:hypothetical protein
LVAGDIHLALKEGERCLTHPFELPAPSPTSNTG